MSTISIKDPPDNDNPFPATIWGKYSLASRAKLTTPGTPDPAPADDTVPLPTTVEPSVTIWVTAEDGRWSYGPASAAVAADSATTGTWTKPKPTGIPAGAKYIVVATVSHPSYPADTAYFKGIAT